jgi:hypothetical protein
MRPTIRLTTLPEETQFAPLGVLGYCLTRTYFLDPVLKSVRLPLKTVAHSPASKLLDVLVSLLAGCRAIRHVNTRLRPDLALARAWGRERFAEQAPLARPLDGFTAEQIAHLRQGSEFLLRRESRTRRHPFAKDWLWLDIDLTPLPASNHAEASTQGKLGAKKPFTGGNWHECRHRHITKRACPSFTLAHKRVVPSICRSCRRSTPSWV